MTNKVIAVNFLTLAAKGEVEEAYEKYVEMSGIHHNIYFKKGFPALRQAMKEAHKTDPNKAFHILHVLEDGNLVAVHSKVSKEHQQIAVVHLFRFQNQKIVEMWDCGMLVPKDSPNTNGAF